MIKNTPPRGVIGPREFKFKLNVFCKDKRYIEKEKNIIPKLIKFNDIFNLLVNLSWFNERIKIAKP